MPYLLRLSSIVWRLGLSGRGAKLIFGTVATVVAAAFLAAMFSLRQPAAVAMDVGISAYKILVILLAIVWVQDLVCRDLDRKSVLLPLGCPISRSQYLMSRFLGIWGLLGVTTLLMAIGVWAVANFGVAKYPQAVPVGDFGSVLLTFVLLFFEQSVILSFAVLMASVATVQALPMFATIAFAIICRSIGPVVTFLTQVDTEHRWVSADLHHVVGVIEWGLPDLSRFDLRGMAVYGDPAVPSTLALLLAIAVAYSALLLVLASWTFRRRDIL